MTTGADSPGANALAETVLVIYEGDDPDVYVLSVNLRHRSLTKGQAAAL